MKLSKLKKAVEAAERFQEAARAAKRVHAVRCIQQHGDKSDARVENLDTCPREQGALRRASLDLTRALADLRRPNA